ncbi:MAG: hypothetical protein HC888_00040 [Candidatus Competibacteraceae bacterium]|nr:hypothetical protein [Candidatus Competibacteraceae bacterium]
MPPKVEASMYALSCLVAHDLYGNVELYTDSEGAKLLLDKLQLPYQSVSISLDAFIANAHLPVFCKYQTVLLQESPFIHIDSDVFLNCRLPEELMEERAICGTSQLKNNAAARVAETLETYLDYVPRYYYRTDSLRWASCDIFGGSDFMMLRDFAASIISTATSLDNRYAWPRIEKVFGARMNQFSMVFDNMMFPAYAAHVGADYAELPSGVAKHLSTGKYSGEGYKWTKERLQTLYPVHARLIDELD